MLVGFATRRDTRSLEPGPRDDTQPRLEQEYRDRRFVSKSTAQVAAQAASLEMLGVVRLLMDGRYR
jgi:hypothetical protein